MSESAERLWSALVPPWRLAFEEAWRSWCDGNLGIGAALVDPGTDQVVSLGRNRVDETVDEPNQIGGNFMAHAEMNAFAAMRRYKADGLHLYTTLEPCLMCAGTAVFLHVERIHFAVADEYFDGLHQLWEGHPYTRKWRPETVGPIARPLAGLARLLPLVVEARLKADGPVMAKIHEHDPEVGALAVELAGDRTFDDIAAAGGGIVDALAAVHERLPAEAARHSPGRGTT